MTRHVKASRLHDRRAERGGARNVQAQWLDEYESEIEVSEPHEDTVSSNSLTL